MKREFTHAVILIGLVSFVLAEDDLLVTPVITELEEVTQYPPKSGRLYSMRCKANPFPKQSYEWHLNRKAINDTNLVSNNMTGELKILNMSVKFEGMYRCLVTNTFGFGGWARAVSPEKEIRIPRVVNKGPKDLENNVTVTEGDYLHLPCNKTRPQFYGRGTTIKWYSRKDPHHENKEIIVTESKTRIYIDQTGDLHIINALMSDVNTYICAVSLTDGIVFITENHVTVTKKGLVQGPFKPILRYKTGGSSLTVLVNENAILECIFSGYFTANDFTLPTIIWFDSAGKPISNSKRHRISPNGMQLTIQEVTREDSGRYYCRASDQDSTEGPLILNVTSTPRWNERLKTIVAIENNDVILNCSAWPVSGPPEWYYNGIRLGPKYEKYVFSSDKTQLTVKNVKKAFDVMCFQCYVRNSVGEEFSQGCLNIFLPITFTQQPALTQTIQKGDVVDLTVVATGDPTVQLEYEWRFRDLTYKMDNAPPHVTYNPATYKAYINTSRLTDAQMLEIQGVYTRSVYYRHQTKELAIEVIWLGAPKALENIAGGFEYWVIGLALGIIILAAAAFVIIFIIIQRKKQEGAYLVDKKEVAAGLNPQKELKDSGFLDLSRIDPEDYPGNQQSKMSGAFDIENCLPVGDYADDAESFSEYGEETTRFNEDGSFIGAYKESQKAVQQRRTSESFV